MDSSVPNTLYMYKWLVSWFCFFDFVYVIFLKMIVIKHLQMNTILALNNP